MRFDPVKGADMALQTMRQRLPRNETGEFERVGEDHADARARLVTSLRNAIADKGMTQVQASRLLGTDQPTLSKVLRGRTASVSLDKLVSWLLVLGRSVEIRVYEPAAHMLPTFTVSVPGSSNA